MQQKVGSTIGLGHHSGRVIAIGRLLLASAFLVAIWLDASQPSRAPAGGYIVLGLYVLAAAVLLSLTWRSWWMDRLLALPAHVMDVAVFTMMVFLTEGYTSPFFTFFVFLLLSATIRWGWRETAVTAAVVIPLFCLAGVAALLWGEAEFELRRFLFRAAYLVVLSLLFVWFSLHQRGGRSRDAVSIDPEDASDTSSFMHRGMNFAARRSGAGRVIFAWSEWEEPWLNVAELTARSMHSARLSPERYGDVYDRSLSAAPFLFGAGDQLLIRDSRGGTKLARRAGVFDSDFAANYGLVNGMAIPIQTSDHSGIILLLDVDGLSSDALKTGEAIGDEIENSLERLARLRAIEDSAATRTRLSLARDLHDSTVQLLAGLSFRLEAIRRAARAGRDLGPEIDVLQSELSREQRELRDFIGNMRSAGAGKLEKDMCGGLDALATQLGKQWGISCVLECVEDVPVSAAVRHHVHHLVREGVANAVRHGGATLVTLRLQAREAAVFLEIVDNGSGFAQVHRGESGREEEVIPQSLNDRVRQLGGNLELRSTSAGSYVRVSLPREARL